ncbi:MAG: hypothetical protein WBP26_02740 [Candidatus Saccharimonadales bacterium]
MSRDVSIEYAQPYENATEASDAAGVAALHQTLGILAANGETHSLVSLVDDTTHESEGSYDYDAYGKWLQTKGFEPELVARESEIKEVCDSLLAMLDQAKLPQELQESFAQGNTHVSPLFIASWCLMRLGYIQHETVLPESLQAKKLVNILPESFKPDEDLSLAIIAASPFAEATQKIEYIFIP